MAKARVPAGLKTVTTKAEAIDLARYLQDSGRKHPVAVVTVSAGHERPWVDADELAREVAPWTEVFLMSTGDASWAFSDEMPEGTQVFGGACRVYAVGVEWVHNIYLSKLRFAYDAKQGELVRARLVSDALAAAMQAGLVGKEPSKSRQVSAKGEVIGLTAKRAIVRLAGGGMATIHEGLTLPGVPIERVLTKGMRVVGRLDSAARRLDIYGSLPNSGALRQRFIEAFAPGDVTLVQVVRVEADGLIVRVAPKVEVRVPKVAITRNDLDDLDDLFYEGEAIPVRIVKGEGISLRMDDAEYDEALDQIAIFAGGPPWLVEAEEQEEELPPPADEPAAAGAERDEAPGSVPEPTVGAPTPSTPTPAPPRPPTPADLRRRSTPEADTPSSPPSPPSPKPSPPSSALAPAPVPVPAEAPVEARDDADLRTLLKQAQQQLRDAEGVRKQIIEEKAEEVRKRRIQEDTARRLEREVNRLMSKISRDEVDQKRAKKQRFAATKAVQAAQPSTLSDDPGIQFHIKVLLAWEKTFTVQTERNEYPLRRYRLGPDFLASMERELPNMNMNESLVLRWVVNVLAGREEVLRSTGAQRHQMRTGPGGDDSARERSADGAKAFRVALQTGPGARRLLYWEVPGNEVELVKVAHHDDYDM